MAGKAKLLDTAEAHTCMMLTSAHTLPCDASVNTLGSRLSPWTGSVPNTNESAVHHLQFPRLFDSTQTEDTHSGDVRTHMSNRNVFCNYTHKHTIPQSRCSTKDPPTICALAILHVPAPMMMTSAHTLPCDASVSTSPS